MSDEWERIEKEKKLREQWEGIISFIDTLMNEITEKDKQIEELKKENGIMVQRLHSRAVMCNEQCYDKVYAEEQLNNAKNQIAELETQNNNLQIMLQAEREVRINKDYLKMKRELRGQIAELEEKVKDLVCEVGAKEEVIEQMKELLENLIYAIPASIAENIEEVEKTRKFLKVAE